MSALSVIDEMVIMMTMKARKKETANKKTCRPLLGAVPRDERGTGRKKWPATEMQR